MPALEARSIPMKKFGRSRIDFVNILDKNVNKQKIPIAYEALPNTKKKILVNI